MGHGRFFMGALCAAGMAVLVGGSSAQAHDPLDPPGTGDGATGSGTSHHMTLLGSSPSGPAGARPTNSDMAFWGNLAFVGNYNGFRIFDLSSTPPVQVSDVRCPGAQGDPSVYDRDGNGSADLLVLSVDRTMSGPHCGAVPVAHDEPTGWEGLRLFDVSTPTAPVQIGAVYQDCGSHTNTLLPSGNRLYVLNSSYPLRPGPTCGPVRGPAAGRDPLHGVVAVVEIDLADPTRSREIAELPITYPGDPDNTYLPIHDHGLNNGVPAPGLVDGMRACHDISVFVELGLVAAACAEQAQLWRIDPATGLPDTRNPLWVYDQPNVDFWHSATFSWDGKYANFIDESFGGGCPTTTVKRDLSTPEPADVREYASGNMFFMRVSDGKLLSEYRIPRGTNDNASLQTPEYCSSHLGNVVPARNRYLLVNAYYRGGTSLIDFSDPTDPREIAFHDAANADTWSAYWYENTAGHPERMRIYSNDGVHTPNTGAGFQTFQVDLAASPRVALDHLNPQVQERVIKTSVSQAWKHQNGNPRSFAAGSTVNGGQHHNRPASDVE